MRRRCPFKFLALTTLAVLLAASLGTPIQAITPKDSVTLTLDWVGRHSFSVTGKITTSRLIASKGFQYRKYGETDWEITPFEGTGNPYTSIISAVRDETYEVRAYCVFSKTETIYSKIVGFVMSGNANVSVHPVTTTHNSITVAIDSDPAGNLMREVSVILYGGALPSGGLVVTLAADVDEDAIYTHTFTNLDPETEYMARARWVTAENPSIYFGVAIIMETLAAPTATPKPTSVATPAPTSPGDPTATPQPTATNPPDPTDTQAPEPTTIEPTTEPSTTGPTTAGPTNPADTPTEGDGGPITITDAVTQPESQGGLFGDMGGGALALIVGLAAAVLLVLGILVGKLGRKA